MKLVTARGVLVDRYSPHVSAYALRVWNGQSSVLDNKTRVQRIQKALVEQGWSLDECGEVFNGWGAMLDKIALDVSLSAFAAQSGAVVDRVDACRKELDKYGLSMNRVLTASRDYWAGKQK